MNERSIPEEMNEVILPDFETEEPVDVDAIDGPADEHPLRPSHIDEKREEMKHFKPPHETVAPPVPDPAKLQDHR